MEVNLTQPDADIVSRMKEGVESIVKLGRTLPWFKTASLGGGDHGAEIGLSRFLEVFHLARGSAEEGRLEDATSVGWMSIVTIDGSAVAISEILRGRLDEEMTFRGITYGSTVADLINAFLWIERNLDDSGSEKQTVVVLKIPGVQFLGLWLRNSRLRILRFPFRGEQDVIESIDSFKSFIVEMAALVPKSGSLVSLEEDLSEGDVR